jgi:hypothetical protein
VHEVGRNTQLRWRQHLQILDDAFKRAHVLLKIHRCAGRVSARRQRKRARAWVDIVDREWKPEG